MFRQDFKQLVQKYQQNSNKEHCRHPINCAGWPPQGPEISQRNPLTSLSEDNCSFIDEAERSWVTALALRLYPSCGTTYTGRIFSRYSSVFPGHCPHYDTKFPSTSYILSFVNTPTNLSASVRYCQLPKPSHNRNSPQFLCRLCRKCFSVYMRAV